MATQKQPHFRFSWSSHLFWQMFWTAAVIWDIVWLVAIWQLWRN